MSFDRHRNSAHRRVVTNDNKNKSLMIFETDEYGICVQSRTSFLWDDRENSILVCQARLQAYATGRDEFSPKAQQLETIEKQKVPQFYLLRVHTKERALMDLIRF